jgi:hypothetical protein
MRERPADRVVSKNPSLGIARRTAAKSLSDDRVSARRPWPPFPSGGRIFPGVFKVESAKFSRLALRPTCSVLGGSPFTGRVGPSADQRSCVGSTTADQSTAPGGQRFSNAHAKPKADFAV